MLYGAHAPPSIRDLMASALGSSLAAACREYHQAMRNVVRNWARPRTRATLMLPNELGAHEVARVVRQQDVQQVPGDEADGQREGEGAVGAAQFTELRALLHLDELLGGGELGCGLRGGRCVGGHGVSSRCGCGGDGDGGECPRASLTQGHGGARRTRFNVDRRACRPGSSQVRRTAATGRSRLSEVVAEVIAGQRRRGIASACTTRHVPARAPPVSRAGPVSG